MADAKQTCPLDSLGVAYFYCRFHHNAAVESADSTTSFAVLDKQAESDFQWCVAHLPKLQISSLSTLSRMSNAERARVTEDLEPVTQKRIDRVFDQLQLSQPAVLATQFSPLQPLSSILFIALLGCVLQPTVKCGTPKCPSAMHSFRLGQYPDSYDYHEVICDVCACHNIDESPDELYFHCDVSGALKRGSFLPGSLWSLGQACDKYDLCVKCAKVDTAQFFLPGRQPKPAPAAPASTDSKTASSE
jgi:hypothetical protein